MYIWYIFWTNVSKESTQNVGASNKHLCTYFYEDPTFSSILQAEYKAKIRKP